MPSVHDVVGLWKARREKEEEEVVMDADWARLRERRSIIVVVGGGLVGGLR